MTDENVEYVHTSYLDILRTRGMQGLQKNMPLWKFKLSEGEYEALKQTLRIHTSDLAKYGEEAVFAMRSGGEETIRAIFLPKKMLLWVLEFIAVMPTSCIKLREKHYKNMVIRFYTH